MRFRHPEPAAFRVEDVLTALGNPLRLAAVRVLDSGGEHNCTSVLDVLGVTSASTMTRHWRVLRESGVIWQEPVGRENLLTLRRADLDTRYPGLLDSILQASATDSTDSANETSETSEISKIHEINETGEAGLIGRASIAP